MRTSTKTKAIYREEAEEDGPEEESVGPSDQWDTEVPGLDAWLGAGAINQTERLPDWPSREDQGLGQLARSSAAGQAFTEQMSLDSEV